MCAFIISFLKGLLLSESAINAFNISFLSFVTGRTFFQLSNINVNLRYSRKRQFIFL